MNKRQIISTNNKRKTITRLIGQFGCKCYRYKGKPRLAIKHLMNVKSGECIGALYREDIGYIDIVWGKVTDSVKHTGFGLSHIIDKHGKTIKQLGFKIEDFIPIVVQYGNLYLSKNKEEYILESQMFRVIIERYAYGKEKQWLLTSFDLQKRPKQ